MSTVYVVQENPKVDVVSANRFGELKALADRREQVHLRPENIINNLKRQLRCFNDDDYLLLIGDPSIIGIACSIASDINMGYYKVLKWDRKREKYHPIEVNIRRNENDENKL